MNRLTTHLWIGLSLLLAVSVGWSSAEGADIPRFAIDSYRVEGNSLLSSKQITTTLQPFTGQSEDFGTVQRALETLQESYQELGYRSVVVLLPEQELEGGEVLLQVIEPRLGSASVSGNNFFSETNIRASLPGLTEGQVPNLDDISASLRVANGNPSKQVRLKLESDDLTRGLIARLEVNDRKPWQIGLSLDDTGTDSTGQLRLGFFFSHANLFNADHLLTLQYQTSPEKSNKVGIYSLGYRLPLYSLGDSIDLFVAYSDVDSGTVSAGTVELGVAGRGTLSGLRYNHNLRRRGNYEQSFIFGVDYRAYRNDVTLGSSALGNDITLYPVSLAYTGRWQSSNPTWFSLTLVQNIPGGNNGSSADFAKVRKDASAAYHLLRVSGGGSWKVPGDGLLQLRLNGQYTDEPLVSGEAMGLGGADSLRGFDEREVADDRGLLATCELYSPDLAQFVALPQARLRLLAFYDVGWLERVDPQPGEDAQTSLASFGAGLRLALGSEFNARADYAYVLEGSGGTGRGDNRWHFSLNLKF